MPSCIANELVFRNTVNTKLICHNSFFRADGGLTSLADLTGYSLILVLVAD